MREFGFDRAGIWIELEAESDLVVLGVLKKFPLLATKSIGRPLHFKIPKHKFINEIQVRPDFNKTRVKVDFSYPRYFRENNLQLSGTEERREVEKVIVELVEEISLEKVDMKKVYYNNVEICIQKKVGAFYYYHNLVNLIYKSLCRKYQTVQKAQYSNYSEKMDRFYSTGFQFSMQPGMKLKLYSKLHEHNPKTPSKEVGAILRTEYRLTRGVLKKLFETDKVIELELSHIQYCLVRYFEKSILKLIKEELELNHEKLVKMLKGFNPRELKGIVKDLQEWIFDYKCLGAALTEVSCKSPRQTKRYLEATRKTLEESQSSSSPKRDNFNNIKRLEKFLQDFLFLDYTITHKYGEGLKWSKNRNLT